MKGGAKMSFSKMLEILREKNKGKLVIMYIYKFEIRWNLYDNCC